MGAGVQGIEKNLEGDSVVVFMRNYCLVPLIIYKQYINMDIGLTPLFYF